MASIGSPKWRLCHDRARPNYRVQITYTHLMQAAEPEELCGGRGVKGSRQRGSRSSDENCRGKSKQTVHHQKLRQLNEIQMKNE